VSSAPTTPNGLHFVADSPVEGLAVAERRVAVPEATLICVHGGLDRGGSFARLARRVNTFDVVTYDRRGYQGSRDLQPLTFELHVADLLALARREYARGPVIVFGHSYGGVVALGAAIADPSLVQLAVLYEAPLPWILRREGMHTPLTADPEHEAELFFRRLVSDAAWERLSELERDSRRRDGAALISDLSSLRDASLGLDLTQLTVATTYAYGDERSPDYYRELCDKLAQLNPLIGRRELHNAGHGAHLSIPDQLAAMIESLWRETCASA
jgi:pimeloyl-ACP methyl ester carboxylesterase